MSVSAAARRVASAGLSYVSPRHRRWRALLQSCTLTPEHAGSALDERDFIICGCPRSGTALATAALFQAPDCVTVMEPWRALQSELPAFFEETRSRLARSGQLADGRLRVDLLKRDGSVVWQRDAEQSFGVDCNDQTLLGVKWPTFWQLLGRVDARFVVCVRDPAEVVDSFERQGARLGQGLEYDVAFNRALNARLGQVADLETRRIALYDEANTRILSHAQDPKVFVLRYERWFAEREVVLEELSDFLGFDATRSAVRITAPGATISEARRDAVRRRSATAAALGYEAD